MPMEKCAVGWEVQGDAVMEVEFKVLYGKNLYFINLFLNLWLHQK